MVDETEVRKIIKKDFDSGSRKSINGQASLIKGQRRGIINPQAIVEIATVDYKELLKQPAFEAWVFEKELEVVDYHDNYTVLVWDVVQKQNGVLQKKRLQMIEDDKNKTDLANKKIIPASKKEKTSKEKTAKTSDVKDDSTPNIVDNSTFEK